MKYAVVPALSTCIGVTAVTPAVAATSFWSVVSRGSVVRGSLCELDEDEELEPELEPDPDEDEPEPLELDFDEREEPEPLVR